MGTRSRKRGSFDRSELFKKNYYQRTDPNPITQKESNEIVTPSVTVSFGEEEGGFFDSFKRLVGKGGNNDTSSVNTGGSSSEGAVADDSSLHANTVPDGDFATIHRQFLDDSLTIEEKEHSGRYHTNRDSRFKKVKTTVRSLNDALNGSVNFIDRKKYLLDLDKIIIKYQKALAALKDYFEIYGADDVQRTPEIESRLGLIRPFISLFEKDMAAFSAVARDVTHDEAASLGSFNDILFKARVVDLTNTTDQLESEGAGTSVLIVRTKSDGAVDYIKPEERSLSTFDYNFNANTASREDYAKMRSAASEVVDMFKSQSSESEALYNEYLRFFEKEPLMKKDGTPYEPDYSLRTLLFHIFVKDDFRDPIAKPEKRKGQSDDDYKQTLFAVISDKIKSSSVYIEFEPFKAFFDHFTENADRTLQLYDFLTLSTKKRTESITSYEMARVERGSTISDRNVSTSIMAEGLGVEDIVARSQTILMKDHHGNVIRANSMEKAEGVEIGKLRDEAAKAEKEDAEQKAASGSKEPLLKVVVTLTPNALVQLSDLHVFDMICGQVDRKDSNYIVQYQKMPPDEENKAVWYVTSVKAIDNDMAFGNLTLQDVKDKGTGELAEFFITEKAQDATLQDQNLFCVSKQLYDRIMAYSPDMAAVSQRHLRTDSEIKALQGRLEGVKSKLKEMRSAGKLVLVENDEQAKAVYQTVQQALADKSEANRTGYIIKAILRSEGLNYSQTELSDSVAEEVSDDLAIEAYTSDSGPEGETSTIERDEESSFINPLYEGKTSKKDSIDETDASALPTGIGNTGSGYGDLHRSFLEYSREVIENKRKAIIGHHSNGGAYGEVQNAIRKLVDVLSAPVMNSDKEVFLSGIRSVISVYDFALLTLNKYAEDKKGAITPSGRSRLRMVSRYITLLEQDRKGFFTASETMLRGEDYNVADYNDIMLKARLVDLTNTSDKLETVGAGTSIITKRTQDNGKVDYIKSEERTFSEFTFEKNYESKAFSPGAAVEFIDMYKKLGSKNEALLSELLNFFKETPMMNGEKPLQPETCLKQLVIELINDESLALKASYEMFFSLTYRKQTEEEAAKSRLLYYKTSIKSSAPYKLSYIKPVFDFILSDDNRVLSFKDFYQSLGKKMNEADTANRAKISGGSTISDRNVSTSIVAHAIDSDELVARSDTVLARDDKGDVVRANSMEEVQGISMGNLDSQAKYAEMDDEEERKKSGSTRPPLKVSIVLTPHAYVQLSDLTVLDFICGQIDRNMANYICSVDKEEPDDKGEAIWYVTSVKGIDNDMSFGNASFEDIYNSRDAAFGTSGALYRSQEESARITGFGRAKEVQSIMCISSKMFNGIMSYSPNMAALDQKHLRSDEEIKAIKSRLEGCKKQLLQMLDDGKLRIVDSSDDEALAYQEAMTSGFDGRLSGRTPAKYMVEALYH